MNFKYFRVNGFADLRELTTILGINNERKPKTMEMERQNHQIKKFRERQENQVNKSRKPEMRQKDKKNEIIQLGPNSPEDVVNLPGEIEIRSEDEFEEVEELGSDSGIYQSPIKRARLSKTKTPLATSTPKTSPNAKYLSDLEKKLLNRRCFDKPFILNEQLSQHTQNEATVGATQMEKEIRRRRLAIPDIRQQK